MQTVVVPAARGWRWLADGFRLFRRNPPALALLVVLYWLLMAMINIVPYVGPVVASLCIPVFSVGIMNACREIDGRSDAENGRLVGPPFLFSAFRKNASPLFVLGGLYLAFTLLVLFASSLVDGGTLMQLMLGGNPEREAFEAAEFLVATQVALLLLTPGVMAWWYAPILVAWHGFSPAKALFFSFFACLRNWRAFLGYALSLVVWGVMLPGLLLGILAGLFAGTHFVVALLSAPVLLILAPTVFASFFITYRDVFAPAEHVDIRA